MASTDQLRPYRYQGTIKFDVPGVTSPIEARFGSGGAGKGSTPYGDWPITQYNPHTPKFDLEGFALNNIYGRMPDPLYSDGRSDVMLHLDPKGRNLDQIKSLGCLSVTPEDWPALRDQIISLQKQGYNLVAHVDPSGQVTIRQAEGTAGTPVSSASAFADATKAARAPIKDLQTTLAKAGFNPGKIDGIQGPQTTAAIKAFQQANGLQADGIVGPMTSAVLAASGGSKSTAPAAARSQNVPQAYPFTPKLLPDGTRAPGTGVGVSPQARAAAGASALDTGLGAMSDPRTSVLLAPKPMPIRAPTVNEARSEQAMARAISRIPAAPVPLPGRPASLMAAPPAPVQAPPAQLPTPRQIAPVAPPVAPQLRLASGKTIAPGIYDQGDHSVRVSDDGNGNAVIERVRGPMSIPGVIDPLREANANTIAGGMIRKMLPGQLAGNASAFVPTVTDNVKSAAVNAASNLGNSITGMFGGLFGGAPKPANSWPSWNSSPAQAAAPAAPVAPSIIQVLNPAYTAWQASQTPALKAGQAYTATGSIIPQSMADAMRAISASAYQQPIVRAIPAPPKYITQTVRAPAPVAVPAPVPRQVASPAAQSAAQWANAFRDAPAGSPFW